jgi:molybdate transport system ATP-binding protein
VTLLALADGLTLAVPLCEAAPGALLRVGFRADEVMLCRERPAGLSARNVLPGTIRRVDDVANDVLVSLGVGPVTLLVRVTPAAARELHLAPDRTAFAVVKTTSIHPLG